MIMDERLEFSDSGAWNTQSTNTVIIGDVIDLGVAGRFPSAGKQPYLVILVETTNDGGSGTSGTMQFRLCSDSTSAVAVDGTETRHYVSDTFAAGQLVGGKTRLVVPLPLGSWAYERYLAFQIAFGTEEEDDCVGSAFITFDPIYWVSKPDAANSNP